MATTPNQKPVPSEDYANMRFNAGKFDEFMTSTASSYVDRLGVTHLTVKGIQASVTGALLPANNLSDVQSAATSRANLGLGTVAVESIVPITKGGTGATNATTAMSNLFGMPLIQAFSNVDVNTLTSNGLYSIPSTATNIPVASLGVLEVYMRFGGTQYCQEFNVLTTSVNRKFFRSGVSGAWTAWKEVAAAGANSDITGLTGIVTAPLFTDANAIPYSGWSYVNASSANIPVGTGGATSMFTNQLNATVSSQLAHNVTANTLYMRGQTAASTYTAWIQLAKGGANSDITSLTGLTTPLSTAQGGTGNTTGLAATATALATSRTFQTNLAITTAVGFTGAANNVHGVTGTLPIANGGTGATTAAAARAALGVAASAGIIDASNASAGVVGEVLSATTTSTSMSNGVAVNLTSLTLTAGDWDVSASFRIVGTNLGQILGGLNTTSATTPSFPNQYNFNFSSFITSMFSDCTPSVRINVNSSTTVYLAMAVGNSSSTATGTGDGYITARRIR